MRRAVLAIAAVSVTVLAGCTSVGGGTPTPASTTKSTGAATTTSESPTEGDAPPITGPALDLGKVSGPCDLLKADQLAARGVTKPGTEETDPAGPGCKWQPDDPGRGTSIDVTILSESDGLDGMYARRELFPVFEPVEIAGYPAVNGDVTDAKHGECSTAVGVAQGEGFLIQVFVYDQKSPAFSTPCSVSSAIAETVVGNLKG
ncbi:MAG: DUF3558 domain-containing protein [Saccharothrix sp.]|nr:DUF3558 domain-containing protein [Saccharothrix sp.]